jgi:predicted nuclease with TOPRIM domain
MIKFTEQNVKLLETLSDRLAESVKNLNKVVSRDRSYNVKQTNLKVFFVILGILHENVSKKSNVMARISDIEIDMDTVQNKMWGVEKDKMKLELEIGRLKGEAGELIENLGSGNDYMEELLNKIKFWLDTLDKSHSSWIRDNFLSENIKNKIVKLEKKYG